MSVEKSELISKFRVNEKDTGSAAVQVGLLSKQIDELKAKEEEAYKNFFELKKRFNDVNEKLKSKLVEIKDISEKLGKNKEESDELRKDRKEKTIEGKKRAVKGAEGPKGPEASNFNRT